MNAYILLVIVSIGTGLENYWLTYMYLFQEGRRSITGLTGLKLFIKWGAEISEKMSKSCHGKQYTTKNNFK